jgi:hypothetical protein
MTAHNDDAHKAAALIALLRSGTLEDSKVSETVRALDALLPDPNWFGYAIDQEPELSPEQVVAKAFDYRPT